MPSLFPRPSALRQTLQTQGGSRAAIEVRSEDELRAAIARIAAGATDIAGLGSLRVLTMGAEIVIAAPFTVSSTVIIPEPCTGMAIRSAGLYPINPKGLGLGALFRVDAEYVSIAGILSGIGGAAWETDDVFVSLGDTSVAGNGLRVERCIAFIDRFIAGATATPNNVYMLDNLVVKTSNLAATVALFAGNSCHARGNEVSGLGPLSGDTFQVTGRGAMIIGNNFGGGDVTTTGGTGLNVVMGNTETGTLNTLGTDAVGLNT